MSVKVSLFVPDNWSPGKRREIVGAFGDVKAVHQTQPGMGAGASGIPPELQLFLTAAGAGIAGGFLQAIGADVWRAIKAGLRKTAKVKPDKLSWVPPELEGSVPLEGVLIWWLKFSDLNVLVIVPLNEDAIEAAVDSLPAAIDRIYFKKGGPDFLRLHWEEDEWKDFT